MFDVKGARFALTPDTQEAAGEIVAVLKKFEAKVEFVRDMRDELHTKLMKWDDVIEVWKPVEPVRGERTEMAIKEIYRFAARNYPQRQDWRR